MDTRRFDAETGIYYYRARYYAPGQGRFLQRDPLDYKDGMGMYVYVGNNPINFIDPYGLEKESWWDKALDVVHTGLDAAGLFPAAGNIADAVNAIIYVAEGDFENAAFAGAAMLPGLGQGATAVKYGKKAPYFVVSPGGTAFPVPKGAQGPVPVINQAGQQTGTAYTGGKGGANQQVDTIRIMDPTPPRGSSSGYPQGYVKYENVSGQGVNPHTGNTGSHADTHFPID